MNIELLKKRKKELNITFDELSEKSGIPKKTLSNIFRGLTPNPRVDTVQAIERALGIGENTNIENYQNGNSLATSNTFVQEYGHLLDDTYFKRYVKIYNVLNNEQRIYVVGLVLGAVEQFGISYRDIG